MNLDNHPTPEQLRDLLARCDDRAGNHVVWVKRNGDVEISVIQHPRVDVRRIQNEPAVLKLQEEHPEMQMRCETFLKGNQYVGPEAAADDEWLAEFLDILVSGCQKAKGLPEVVYVRATDGPKTTSTSQGAHRADHCDV
jgi:hypothetical protein